MALETTTAPSGYYGNGRQGQGSRGGGTQSGSDFISGRQWIRDCDITVGGTNIDGSELRVQIMVRQKDIQHPDWAYIRITNLSKNTTNQLMQLKEYAAVELNAGYKGRKGNIFVGKVFQLKHGKEENGVDKYFDVLATSDHEAYNFAKVNKTIKAGHTDKDLLDEATKSLKEFGVKIGFTAELGEKIYKRASVLFGPTHTLLRDLAFKTNTSWTIFNQSFQMVKVDGTLPGEAKIDANTGMIGLPEQSLNGIVVRVLLNAGFKVGSSVQIDKDSIQEALLTPGFDQFEKFQKAQLPSISPSGRYKVMMVEHDGDSEGQHWYTTLTCRSVEDEAAGILPLGMKTRGVTEQDQQTMAKGGAQGSGQQ